MSHFLAFRLNLYIVFSLPLAGPARYLSDTPRSNPMPLDAYPDLPRTIGIFPSRALHRLLLRHRAACEAAGLAGDALASGDDATVLRWLQGLGRLPAELADDLARIGELADDRGVASLLKLAPHMGAEPHRLGLDPLDFAVNALLDHRELFDDAHGRRMLEELRATTEFAGKHAEILSAVAPDRLRQLEAHLGPQFDARLWSDHCRVTAVRSADKLIFTVAHGDLIRVDEALDAPPHDLRVDAGPVYHSERTVRYRPQRRDVVVYEGRAGRLRVRASDATTIEAYRRSFGRLLFNDGDWFGTEPIVSLQPLIRLGRAVERPTAGLQSVCLVGLIIWEAATGVTHALDADELWPCVDRLGPRGLGGIELIEATLRVRAIGDDTVFRVKLRAPGDVEYRRLSGDLIRPYLEARGFLATAGRALQ